MKPIIDGKGKVIGYLREDTSQVVLTSRNAVPLGYYRKKEDRTYNKSGILIGNGNQLMRLLI